MTTNNEQKIKTLLERHIPGTICLASWLEGQGISRDLQKYYRRSGWLGTVGTGAFKRPNENVSWRGGLYAVQTQAGIAAHIGALTALAMRGHAHYVRLGEETAWLFSPPKTNLPSWFKEYQWGVEIEHVKTSFLMNEIGLSSIEEKSYSIQLSSPERAMLESLYLTPNRLDLVECYQIMEGLGNLRPKLVQELLETCTSVKVKRLFLYLSEKAGHQWLQFIDLKNVELGKGARSIVKNGAYVAKYQISIPKELAIL